MRTRYPVAQHVSVLIVALAIAAAFDVGAQVPATDPAPPVASPAAAPTSQTAARPRPERLGPVTLRFDDGELSLGFASQLRMTTTSGGAAFGEAARETETGLELRRIRLLLRGSFLDDRLAFLLQVSTAPNSLELLDLALDGRIRENASVRVGVFKTPFTLHRNRSFQNLTMTEWDVAAGRFGAERQLGAEVHGSSSQEGGVDYAVGVFSGVNSRAAFARGVAETYDEPMPNASDLRTPQPPTRIHPEIIGRVGYATRGAEPLILSDARGGGLRGYAGLSAAADLRPERTQDFVLRAAAEGVIKFHHVTANLVTYAGAFDVPGGRPTLGMIGATLDVAYRVLPRLEVSARYSRVDTLGAFRDAAKDYVAELVAAADPADVAEILANHAEAGTTRTKQEILVGLGVPMVGRSLVFQLDFGVVRVDREGSANDEDALRLRTQLQFGF